MNLPSFRFPITTALTIEFEERYCLCFLLTIILFEIFLFLFNCHFQNLRHH